MKLMDIIKKDETQVIKFNSSSFFTAKANKEWFRIAEQILWTLFGSLLMAFSIKYFVKEAGIISGGITGVALIISTVTGNLNDFAIYNIVLNVPLFLFGLFKVGHRFALMSVLAIIASSIFTLILPDATFIENGLGANRLIAVFAGGIGLGLSFSIIYRFGASSGGTDFLATYLSTKKGISISQITLFFSIGIVIFGNAIITANAGGNEANIFISDALVYTLIGLFITKLTTEYLYPKFKKCKIEVFTDKATVVRKYIKRSEYPHAYTVSDVYGSRNKKRTQFIIVCSYIERRRTLKMLKEADPTSFIVVTRLTDLLGNFRIPEL